MSYKVTNSYALFSDSLKGEQIIELTASNNLDASGANRPVLSKNMIPVYYDDENDVWRKADIDNLNENHQWYDYDQKMWANSVTVSEYRLVGDEIKDFTANGIDAAVIGSPVYTNEGLSLDGSDDGLFIENGLKDLFKNENTIQIKVKRNQSSVRDVLIGNYSVSNNINYEINASNQYRTYFNNGASDLAGGTAANNKFVLLSYVFNKANNAVKVYENNTLIYTFTYTGYNSYNFDFTSVYIGRDSRTGETALNGTIEKIMIYEKALSAEEISNNIDTEYKKIGIENDGIISDSLLLYYDFRNQTRDELVNAEVGTEIPMKDILTMQVWIPRYKYTIWNYNLDGNATSEPQEINISFEEETKSDGEIVCIDSISGAAGNTSETCKIKSTGAECTDSACNGKTYTHPAFTFGEEQLTGFWIGKFEVSSNTQCSPTASAIGSGCNLATIKPIVKPNVASWRGASVSIFANNIMAMNDDNNIYGFKSADDTHMIKNMEWGAVAYLSHSKYGKNSEIEVNSNSNYLTGCGPQESGIITSGTICNEYNSTLGQSASTTGNTYGVYDMSGGSYDSAMGNMISTDGKLMTTGETTGIYNSGYTGNLVRGSSVVAFSGAYQYPHEKYYDKYSYGSTSEDSTARKRSKLGDGNKEIYSTGPYGWYNDYAQNISGDYSPWISRGGTPGNGIYSGIFSNAPFGGYGSDARSSRLVISQ